ncbi:MAG TPA: 3-phosphoshikimate 1-carboxyvinyltransferase [Candidatus Polarisedimenticolaceae bacterium]|nr:3-phosphoshikimate 1-carboxyvinyltransferase [Candidatus Polarisedimenticolaceae bacterium]
MHARCIEPARTPVDAELTASPSKSWTHRALVAAALADGTSWIERPLDAADTRCTRRGIVSLSIPVEEDASSSWIVRGCSGIVEGGARIDAQASGTSARFLIALAAMGARGSIIDGSPRLRERPMEELILAVRALGGLAASQRGALPVTAGGPMRGGAVTIAGHRSSQFASALLLVSPALPEGLALTVVPPRASFAYVLLTVDVLARFGVVVNRPAEGVFTVAPQRVVPARVPSEGDHSSASYAFLAAAVTGGRVRVNGVDARSAQPDARFSRDLEEVGCAVARDGEGITVEGPTRLRPFDWDLAGAPDLGPAAAVLALFCDGTSRLRGVENLRLKESDRVAALAAGLSALGAEVTVEGDALTVQPPSGATAGATIDVADDHRIAMAFAVAGLRVPGVTVSDARVVEKSYPAFWGDLERLAGR